MSLLSPLPNERVRSVRCVGFNYVAHAEEVRSRPCVALRYGVEEAEWVWVHAMQANVTIPQFPILFYKPFTALNTPTGPIPVTAGYQNQTNFTSPSFHPSHPLSLPSLPSPSLPLLPPPLLLTPSL